MKKTLWTLAAVAACSAAMCLTSFAAGWQQDQTGWKYENEDGTWQNHGWFQDSNGRYYYFDQNGYMLAGTTTPDGYVVSANGVWEGDAVKQTGSSIAHLAGGYQMEYWKYQQTETTEHPATVDAKKFVVVKEKELEISWNDNMSGGTVTYTYKPTKDNTYTCTFYDKAGNEITDVIWFDNGYLVQSPNALYGGEYEFYKKIS